MDLASSVEIFNTIMIIIASGMFRHVLASIDIREKLPEIVLKRVFLKIQGESSIDVLVHWPRRFRGILLFRH